MMTQHTAMLSCVGCGALVPTSAGPTHPYIGASPGCWALFGEVQAVAYADYRMAGVQRLTVDTYAVQHPGVPERRAIQSVAVHLMSLYLTLEHGVTHTQSMQVLQRAADRSHTFTWLTPPASVGALTVVDVHRARMDADAYTRLVTAWAHATWAAWAPHHAQIRQWAAPERAR
jgi:hypothetical protein